MGNKKNSVTTSADPYRIKAECIKRLNRQILEEVSEYQSHGAVLCK